MVNIDYELIAKAVASLLRLMIQEAVDASLQQGIQTFKKEIGATGKRLGEIEQHVSGVEDDMHEAQDIVHTLESTI